MERLLIFTGGTSMLDNLKDPEKKFFDQALVDSFRYKGAGAWRTVLRRANNIRNELVTYAERFAPLDLVDVAERSRATAEMAGLYLLRSGQESSRDRLILLCSDTGGGAFCALANGILLAHEVLYRNHSGKHGTLAGLSETEVQFNPVLSDIRLPRAELVVVKDLNPTISERFERRAIPALIGAIAELHYDCAPDTQTVLNYTGGFKAAIPTLTQAASVAGDIDLVCLYEDATELVKQPVIPINLSPEIRERLIWAGRDAPGHPDILHPDPERSGGYETIQQLVADCKFEEEWVFYEAAPEGGVQLNGLGLAVQELLSAQTHQQRQEEDGTR